MQRRNELEPGNTRLFHFLTFPSTTSDLKIRYLVCLNTFAMMEMAKKILTVVSFDAQLFQKELYKALKWITDSEELRIFQEWCVIEFGAKYPKIIKKAFAEANIQ